MSMLFVSRVDLSLQSRTKSKKSIREVFKCCKLKKVKINSVISFALKTLLPKFLNQEWFTSFNVDYAMNPVTENVLDIFL